MPSGSRKPLPPRDPSMSRILLAILMAVSVPVAAQELTALAPLSYTTLYADSSGVSHFGDESLPWATVRSSGTHETALSAVQQVSFIRIGEGVRMDWHPAPRRQFSIVLEGVVEVVASDGERREFAAGSILLLADTKGTGHQTNVLGQQDFVAVMIQAN